MASASSPQFVGYLLAGGFSRRFGSDKALIELGGRPMLARMLDVSSESLGSPVLVIGAKQKYGALGKCVEDQWPGEGPLGGIITALENTRETTHACPWNVILSCDMPFVTADWLRFLQERAAKSQAQVVYAHSDQGPEPLCACWRTDAVNTLRPAFQRGVRKVTSGIALLKAEVLDAKDWKRFDTFGRLFWNMNNIEDYEAAKRILEAESGGVAQGA